MRLGVRLLGFVGVISILSAAASSAVETETIKVPQGKCEPALGDGIFSPGEWDLGMSGSGQAAGGCPQASNTSGGVSPWPYDFPKSIDPGESFLFYLHGKIIEDLGLRPTSAEYGVYEYEKILEALRLKGFRVISQARPKDTDPKMYADKVAGEVRALLGSGVPPGRITIVGASKGAIIAMLVSTALKNKDLNFVIMANCNDWVYKNLEIDLHGNVLSIYDINDKFGRTCAKFFAKATGLGRRDEIELKVGTGHGILFKPLKEWIEPTVLWAKGEPVGK